MQPLRVAALAIILFITLGLACAPDSLGPEPRLRGLYVLKSVEAEPLPVVLWHEDGRTLWLLSDMFEFDEAGRASRTFRTRRDSLDVVGVEFSTTRQELNYRVRADTVTIGRFEPCPPNALCIPPDVGLFSDNTLALESWLVRGRLGLYQRR